MDHHCPNMPTPIRQLFAATEISTRVAMLGQEIALAMPPGTIHVVGILRGAFIFVADLVRVLPRDVCCDFLDAHSYGSSTETSGVVEITKELRMPIAGQHVLVVEDIVDTGLTLRHLLDLLEHHRPASVHVCALLNKPSRRRTQVPLHFVGFEIPDAFVVGYGLDYDQRYRNLPYIGVIE